MNQSDLKQDIYKNLKALMRDLIQEQYFEAYKSYKALFKIGSPVLPSLKTIATDTDWSNIKHKGIPQYFAGLICLIRDIDENEANSIAENL